MRTVTAVHPKEKAEADELMRWTAGALADLLNRAESEKRSLTLKEQELFASLDEKLTKLLEQYGPPALVTLT